MIDSPIISANPCEVLARVGFSALLENPTEPEDYDDDASVNAARVADHGKVLDILRQSGQPKQFEFGNGIKWLGRRISWPDRVPGLATWSGNQTLAGLVATRRKALVDPNDQPKPKRGRQAKIEQYDPAEPSPFDAFEFLAPITGASGLDPRAAALSSVDVGFSVNDLGLPIYQRPALELLAILGLELVPIVSFGAKEYGFLLGGHLWRFAVQLREGGYYHRWGYLSEPTPIHSVLSLGTL